MNHITASSAKERQTTRRKKLCSGKCQRDQRLQKELLNKANLLEEVLVSERQYYFREKRTLGREVTKLRKAEEKSHQRNGRLCDRIKELTGELADSRDMFEFASNSVDDLEKTNEILQVEKQELQREIVFLESALIFKLATFRSCVGCADLVTVHQDRYVHENFRPVSVHQI